MVGSFSHADRLCSLRMSIEIADDSAPNVDLGIPSIRLENEHERKQQHCLSMKVETQQSVRSAICYVMSCAVRTRCCVTLQSLHDTFLLKSVAELIFVLALVS